MSEVSNSIYFEHVDESTVEKLRRIFSDDFWADNSEYEEIFSSINPEIVALLRQTNNDHQNLSWLDPYPEMLEMANHMLNFDELPKNYRIWMHWTTHYDEAFLEKQFFVDGNGYVIHASNNEFTGPFLKALLELAGASNVSFKQDSLDWYA